MDIETIIAKVRSIILCHAQPERIWLYGSRVTGEATTNSDIDIAYEDINFKKTWLIDEDIEQVPTLVKIDVKNLATTEDRFRQRVYSTGKVLYSANKKLRFEDGLYNFSRALKRFTEALDKKGELEREGYGDIFLDLAVKRFEFTYEMAWKSIKRYLDYAGIGVTYPRACFKEAFSQGLINEEQVWLEMIERRNQSSHIYNQDEISGILLRLDDYRFAFDQLLVELTEKISD